MYQREWFGIPLASVGAVSTRHRAGAPFYEAFYAEFFRRYRQWNELQPEWLRCKRAAARLLLDMVRGSGARSVLSVACGLGAVEQALLETEPSLALDVTDGAETALPWLRRLLPPARVHVGDFPGCLPTASEYDFIYAVAYDYVLDREQFARFIGEARARLSQGGRLVIVSVTYESSVLRSAVRMIRAALVSARSLLPVRNVWQFWGWYRNRDEFVSAMRAGGFAFLDDGFVAGGEYMGQPSYFISGRKS